MSTLSPIHFPEAVIPSSKLISLRSTLPEPTGAFTLSSPALIVTLPSARKSPVSASKRIRLADRVAVSGKVLSSAQQEKHKHKSIMTDNNIFFMGKTS